MKSLVHSEKNKKLYTCHQDLQQGFYTIREAVRTNHPGYDAKIIFGHRTPAEQFEMFKRGRELLPLSSGGYQWTGIEGEKTVTGADGYRVLSAHNSMPSMAMDLVVLDSKGRAVWDSQFYLAIVTSAKLCGFGSGGDFRMKDYGHVFVKANE